MDNNENNKRAPRLPQFSDAPGLESLRRPCRALTVLLMDRNIHRYTVLYALLAAALDVIAQTDAADDGQARWIRGFFRHHADTFGDWRSYLELLEWPTSPALASAAGLTYASEEEYLFETQDWADNTKIAKAETYWLALAAPQITAGASRQQLAQAMMDTAAELLLHESTLDADGFVWVCGALCGLEEFFHRWHEQLTLAENVVSEIRRQRAHGNTGMVLH